jgi:hypothetical protein
VFYRHLPSILYRFDVISAFVIAENARKTISAARRRARPEVKSPFDCLTSIWYRPVLEFFDYLLPVESYSTFRFARKLPFENFGEGIFPGEKIFSLMKPPKGTSLEQSASFEISCVRIGSVVLSVGLVTKQKKVK